LQIALSIIFLVVLAFGFVLMFGAPYLPSLSRQVDVALDIVDLKPGDRIIELGCGDGKVLIAAAKRGFCSVGYELNPILFMIAWLRTINYRSQTKVIFGNFWHKPWPEADAIYIFLLPRLMDKLETTIKQKVTSNIKVVSFAFTFNQMKPKIEKDGVFLYEFNPSDKKLKY